MMHLHLLASIWFSYLNYVCSIHFDSEEINCSSSTWTTIRSNISHFQAILSTHAVKQHSQVAAEESGHSDGIKTVSDRPNFMGKSLTVGILIWPQVVSYHPSINKYTGFSIDLLEEIAHRLNFTYNVTEPLDRQWGAYKNGTWNGLIGNLITKEFDLVAAPLTKQRDREAAIDMVCPVSRQKFRIWILNPKLTAAKSLIIFDLMDLTVSAVFFAVYLGVVVIYALMDITQVDIFSGNYRSQLLLQLDNSGMLFLRTVLQQGSTDLPEGNSRRSILAFWWWFSILGYVIYSATVIATLADNRPVYPFTSIEGMLKQNIYKYGIVGNSVVETFLQESKFLHIRKLLESVRRFAQIDPSVMSRDLTEHYRKMDTEKYAFIGVIRNAPAKYVSLNDDLGESWSCFGLPKNSTLTGPVTNVVHDLRTYGILEAAWRKYGLVHSQPRFDNVTENINSDHLGLDLLKNAFIFLIIGILISGLILMAEIALCVFNNKPVSSVLTRSRTD